MTASGTPETIRHKLTTALDAVHVDIIDESHRHAGHAGARSGGGHYEVLVVSAAFTGLTAVARHRLVYGALAGEMTVRIHALALRTLTPEEWRAQGGA